MSKRCIWIAFIISLILNLILSAILLANKPFQHEVVAIQNFFSGDFPSAYSVITEVDAQSAITIAQNAWVEKLHDKKGNPYKPISGETIEVYSYYKLDLWVVKGTQPVSAFNGVPCAMLSAKGDIISVFYLPIRTKGE